MGWAFTMASFPFLFGRAFIEARGVYLELTTPAPFPFLFRRAFVEASASLLYYSPTHAISLPIWKGFH